MKILNYTTIMSVVVGVWLSGCTDTPESTPLVTLEEYLETIDLTNVSDTESGLYYTINEPGVEGAIEEDDIVVSSFKITSLSGIVYYDSEFANNWHYVLNDQTFLTDGMVEGISLIEMGGKITLYMPSELAYGESGVAQAGIQPNEDLKIEIEHLRFKQSIEAYIVEQELENVQVTASGLHYIVLAEGEGEFPVVGQTVTVDYIGTYFTGTQFDSSHDTGRNPISFPLGIVGDNLGVIDGWDEGIALFKKGGSGILLIPYEMAYGKEGRLDQSTGVYAIPPYEHLRFDIDLIDIE